MSNKMDWTKIGQSEPIQTIKPPAGMRLERVKISEIKVGPRLREANPTKVKEIAESIQSQGLLNKILLDQEKNLVAGLHRYLAIKDELHWEETDCFISDKTDPLDLELQQIDENLIRENLHYLDYDKELARRKEIYLIKHPESKPGGHSQGQSRGAEGKFTEKPKNGETENPTPTFAEETSQKTGKSQSSINEGAFVGKNLIPEAHPLIKKQDRPKKETSTLARQPPHIQKRVTDLMPEHPNTPMPNLIKEAKREEKREEIKNKAPEPAKPNIPPAECQVYWGDSFKILANPSLIAPGTIPLQITSPPYGNGLNKEGYVDWPQPEWESKIKKYLNLAKRAATPGGIIVLVVGTQVQQKDRVNQNLPLDSIVIPVALDEGLILLRRAVWTFEAGVPNNSLLNGRYETICFFTTGLGYYFNAGLVKVPAKTVDSRNPVDGLVDPSDVWYFERVTNMTKDKKALVHPCIYPEGLVERIIKMCSKEGDTVLDAFMGSGQTLAVASRLKRKGIGIEVNPQNEVDVKIMLEGIEYSQEEINSDGK